MSDPSQNPIGMPGETVLCWRCLAPLVELTSENFTGAVYLPMARTVGVPGSGSGELWCKCGTGAVLPYGKGVAAESGINGLRLMVRSGHWTGWRSIGGE